MCLARETRSFNSLTACEEPISIVVDPRTLNVVNSHREHDSQCDPQLLKIKAGHQ